MKTYLILAFSFFLTIQNIDAQVYVNGGKTRHRFAQMTLGIDFLFISSGGISQYGSTLQPNSYSLKPQLFPRLTIGGTHFWGHADFYVTFPITNIFSDQFNNGTLSYTYDPGIETGAKFYPWRIEKNKLRPYLGISLNTIHFRQEDDGYRTTNASKTVYPLHAGLTYQHKNTLIEFGSQYYFNNEIDDFYYRTWTYNTIELPPLAFHLGIKYAFETTLSAEKPYLNGETDKAIENLKSKNKLNSYSLGIGPSAAFIINSDDSDFNHGDRIFLGNHKSVNVFPELGIGYYHHKWDAHANLSLRTNLSQIDAFGLKQRLRRSAATLEVFKFIGDYHGFVPFIGPNVGYEYLSFKETENDVESINRTEKKASAGITFGWDIRPNRLVGFILRTNLRYTPLTFHPTDDSRIVYNQLEFNFIQLVLYPSKMKAIRRL